MTDMKTPPWHGAASPVLTFTQTEPTREFPLDAWARRRLRVGLDLDLWQARARHFIAPDVLEHLARAGFAGLAVELARQRGDL